MHNSSDLSEGEIVEDFSEISSDEDAYFENLRQKLKARKEQLELENSIYADFGKENFLDNRKGNKKQQSRRRLQSGRYGYELPRDVNRNNRSYRASSVFTSNYSMPKRRKIRSRRHDKQIKQLPATSLNTPSSDEDKGNSTDEELNLRLQALKSKLEYKEIAKHNTHHEPLEEKHASQDIEPTAQHTISQTTTEEDLNQLRILALRSTILRKAAERKKRKQIENERPYSPSEDLEPLPPTIDDSMAISPLSSPYNDGFNDAIEIVDMDISNSPISENATTSDMDIVPSPKQALQENDIPDDDNEEELRSLLLLTMGKKKGSEPSRSPPQQQQKEDETDQEQQKKAVAITKNLKLAVERLKQQKHISKSGNKTIREILEEQKKRQKKATASEQVSKPLLILPEALPESYAQTDVMHIISGEVQESHEVYAIHSSSEHVEEASLSTSLSRENFMVRTITNHTSDDVNRVPTVESPSAKTISSVVTETLAQDENRLPIMEIKNIPSKKSRLVTSLDSVIRPVNKLVISINAADTDTDDEKLRKSPPKKIRRTVKITGNRAIEPKLPAPQPEFERNLESYLKKIRMQQETAINFVQSQSNTVVPVPKPTIVPVKSASVSTMISSTTSQVVKAGPVASSAVKHLPLSSQREYEQLLQKMKVIEDARNKKHKARQLKRTKSFSRISESFDQTEAPLTVASTPAELSPKKTVSTAITSQHAKKPKATDTITENLTVISQLDAESQQRILKKSESNLKVHSTNLVELFEKSVTLLDANKSDMEMQKKLQFLIGDLEKKLKKAKINLATVGRRIKLSIPKILQCQTEVLAVHPRHQKCVQICQQVRDTVAGTDYKVPGISSEVMSEGIENILSKNEELLASCSDTSVQRNIKYVSERLRKFAKPVNIASNDNPINEAKETNLGNGIPEKIDVPEDVACISKSSINEAEPKSNEIDEDLKEIEFPEVQKQIHQVLEDDSLERRKSTDSFAFTGSNLKKLRYDSPLDILKSNSNHLPINKIVCPYALEGKCQDQNCKMLHI